MVIMTVEYTSSQCSVISNPPRPVGLASAPHNSGDSGLSVLHSSRFQQQTLLPTTLLPPSSSGSSPVLHPIPIGKANRKQHERAYVSFNFLNIVVHSTPNQVTCYTTVIICALICADLDFRRRQGYVVAFSLAAACGQFFIYYTITTFNPLACATITTTRKFFTIVFSVVTFGHSISLKQWG